MPLSLPAVSRIFGLKSGFQVGITNQEPWALPLACEFSSQLSHLELRECLLNSRAVVDLLQVPTALKTFIYEVTPMTPGSNVLNININRAMEYQMSSLENILLDYVPWIEELKRSPQFCYAKLMPSFANFKKLRTLRIASPFLFGSIQRLRQEGKGPTRTNFARDTTYPSLNTPRAQSHFPRSTIGVPLSASSEYYAFEQNNLSN